MSREQELHDWLLEHKPEAASHNAEECSFCKAPNREEEVSEKIFTQEQHEQLLNAAIERAVTEAASKVDAELVAVNTRLEAAEAAAKEKDAKIAELEATIAARDEADRLAAVAAERKKQAKEVAAFTDEQIEARLESWSHMDDESFKAYLDDIRAVAQSSKPPKKPSVLDGTRETAGESGEESVIATFFETGLVEAETV